MHPTLTLTDAAAVVATTNPCLRPATAALADGGTPRVHELPGNRYLVAVRDSAGAITRAAVIDATAYAQVRQSIRTLSPDDYGYALVVAAAADQALYVVQ